jgi:hypothetical protein
MEVWLNPSIINGDAPWRHGGPSPVTESWSITRQSEVIHDWIEPGSVYEKQTELRHHEKRLVYELPFVAGCQEPDRPRTGASNAA